MNKKYICTIAVALFAIVSSFALFGLHDGMSEDADASDYIMTLPSDNLNIVVIGAGESANAILSKIGTMENVNATSDLKSNNFIDSTKTNAFIFTDSWIDENKSEAPKAVSDIVKNGSIVSFYKKQIDWSSTDLTVSYGYDDTMMSMCIVNGVSKCYSVTCDDSEEALSRTIQWMNSLVTNNGGDEIVTVSDDYPLGSEIESYTDYQSSGYGWTAVRTHYYKVDDVSSEYDYYAGRYTVTLEPDSGSFNSGIDVASSMDNGYLLKQGPATTADDTVVTVNIGYSASSEGISFNSGCS